MDNNGNYMKVYEDMIKDNQRYMVSKDQVLKLLQETIIELSDSNNKATNVEMANKYTEMFRYCYHSMAYTDSEIVGTLSKLEELIETKSKINSDNKDNINTETIKKDALLAQMKTLTELVRAEPSLQTKDAAKKDQKVIADSYNELNKYFENLDGNYDDELRDAKGDLDRVIQAKQNEIGLYENVGFEETISDEELDTLMERIVDSMVMSGELAIQITDLTEKRLDSAPGRAQLQTEELKKLNDSKEEKDNITKPAIIKATKNIAELHKKSEEDFVRKLTEIGNRQSRLIRSQEAKRREEFDGQKQRMIDRFAREMEENEKMAYISEGAKRDQYMQKYEFARMNLERAQGMQFTSFPQAYDRLQKEKQILIAEQNKTRAKYADYVDNLENFAINLGIYKEFIKYKPIITATAGAKRIDPVQKGDNPVPPIDPKHVKKIDGGDEPNPSPMPTPNPINPSNNQNPSLGPGENPSINPNEYHLNGTDIVQDPRIVPSGDPNEYHLNGSDIIQDPRIRPNGTDIPGGSTGNGGNNGGNNGSNPPGKNNDTPTHLLPGKVLGKDRPTGPNGPNGIFDPSNPNYDPNNPNNDPNSKKKPNEEPKGPDEDEPEEVPTSEIKIIAKKVWTWTKDHKKEILIAAGIAGLIILALNAGNIAALLAQKSAIKGMFLNGGFWNKPGFDNVTLHKLNEHIASKTFGSDALFHVGGKLDGLWTIGGKQLDVAAAAINRKLIAANAAGVLSIGSLGLGLGSLLKGKTFKQYSEEIIIIKKGNIDSLDDVEKQLDDIKERVRNDDKLSRKEKDALLKQANQVKEGYEIKFKNTSKSKTPTPETTEEPTIASEEIDINNMSDEEYENYKNQIVADLMNRMKGMSQDQAEVIAEQILEETKKKKGM